MASICDVTNHTGKYASTSQIFSELEETDTLRIEWETSLEDRSDRKGFLKLLFPVVF